VYTKATPMIAGHSTTVYICRARLPRVVMRKAVVLPQPLGHGTYGENVHLTSF